LSLAVVVVVEDLAAAAQVLVVIVRISHLLYLLALPTQ
jgi:hypothetical protein